MVDVSAIENPFLKASQPEKTVDPEQLGEALQQVDHRADEVGERGTGLLSRLGRKVQELKLSSLGSARPQAEQAKTFADAFPARFENVAERAAGRGKEAKTVLNERIDSGWRRVQTKWLELTQNSQISLQLKGIEQVTQRMKALSK